MCVIIAVVSSLCSTPEQEQLMVMWLSWMIKEEEYFERYDRPEWTSPSNP